MCMYYSKLFILEVISDKAPIVYLIPFTFSKIEKCFVHVLNSFKSDRKSCPLICKIGRIVTESRLDSVCKVKRIYILKKIQKGFAENLIMVCLFWYHLFAHFIKITIISVDFVLQKANSLPHKKIYRALFGDAMLVPIQIGTNMAAANRPTKNICHWVLLQKREFISRGNFRNRE